MSDIDVSGFARMTEQAKAIAETIGAWALTLGQIARAVQSLDDLFPSRHRVKRLRFGPTAFHYARARAQAKRRGLGHEPATVEMWAWHYRRVGMAGQVIP